MISDALGSSIVAVDKSCVGFPGTRSLVHELFAVVVGVDPDLDFSIDCFLDKWGDISHLRSKLSDVLCMSETSANSRGW